MPDQITLADAAKRLGVTDKRIHALIQAGKLPATEPLGKGRGYLVDSAAVEARRRLKSRGKLPKGGRPKLT